MRSARVLAAQLQDLLDNTGLILREISLIHQNLQALLVVAACLLCWRMFCQRKYSGTERHEQ
jgi:hypothetical protein